MVQSDGHHRRPASRHADTVGGARFDEGDPNEHARVAAAVVLVHLVEFVDKYREVVAEGRRRRLEVNSGLQGERYVILRIGFGALR
jgi:hypothetical protein